MRRFVAPALLLGLLATGLGCQRAHIGGMNDVYHHPDNAIVNTGNGNPYHVSGQPITGGVVPEKMPAPLPVPVPAGDKGTE